MIIKIKFLQNACEHVDESFGSARALWDVGTNYGRNIDNILVVNIIDHSLSTLSGFSSTGFTGAITIIFFEFLLFNFVFFLRKTRSTNDEFQFLFCPKKREKGGGK